MDVRKESIKSCSHNVQPTEDETEGSKLGSRTFFGQTNYFRGTKLEYLKSAGIIYWGTCQEVTKRDLYAIEGAVMAVDGPFVVDRENTISKEHNDRSTSTIDNGGRSNSGHSHAEEQKMICRLRRTIG